MGGTPVRRLPDTELEVMKALWELEGRPAARAELEERLRDRGWATNTFNTYLARLAEKGFVTCEKRGRSNWYAPAAVSYTHLDVYKRQSMRCSMLSHHPQGLAEEAFWIKTVSPSSRPERTSM